MNLLPNNCFNTGLFQSSVNDTVEGTDCRRKEGLIEVIFDIRNKKDFEILEALKQFGQTLLEIKQEKRRELAVLSSFFAFYV